MKTVKASKRFRVIFESVKAVIEEDHSGPHSINVDGVTYTVCMADDHGITVTQITAGKVNTDVIAAVLCSYKVPSVKFINLKGKETLYKLHVPSEPWLHPIDKAFLEGVVVGGLAAISGAMLGMYVNQLKE